MNNEPGRCRCGGIGFQRSSNLPGNYVVCYKCHMIWMVNDNKTRLLKPIPKSSLSGVAMNFILEGMTGVSVAFKPMEPKISLIDLMMD